MGSEKDVLGDYVRQVRESTQQYAKDLLEENEKLLALATSLSAEKSKLEEQIEALRAQLESHRAVQRSLMDEMTDIEANRRELSSRYLEVEQSNNNLASLYVASYGLHSSLERADVVRSIHEVLVNIIGSEEFAIVEQPAGGAFAVTSSMGLDATRAARLRLDEGRVGDALNGITFVRGEDAGGAPAGDGDLTACIPLRVGGRVHGAILVFRLLAHKPALEAVDRELFDLLATHAASALYCCELHARVGALATGEAAQ
jgi:hypothetical protein